MKLRQKKLKKALRKGDRLVRFWKKIRQEIENKGFEISDTEATYETKRKGARNPVRLTHTIEMARQAWPKTKADWEKSFLASGWGRNPTDMLVARSSSRLARMVYPDLLSSLYTPEELAEIREQVA